MKTAWRLRNKPDASPTNCRVRQFVAVKILRREFVTGASELLKLNVAVRARLGIPNAA